jgi:hypothetical protein
MVHREISVQILVLLIFIQRLPASFLIGTATIQVLSLSVIQGSNSRVPHADPQLRSLTCIQLISHLSLDRIFEILTVSLEKCK